MKRTQEKRNAEKGITLIALVVTIVVLLILAGITINMLFSNGGIFKTAGDAANAWNDATINEQESLNNLAEQIGNLVNGQTGGGDTPEEIVDITTVTDIVQKEQGQKAKDSYGNIVVVPKGFKVVVSEGTTVPEGIVIEDGAGNQFVWIPTGTYKIDESGTTKTNELTRRQWGTTANTVQEPTPITGDEVASGSEGAFYYGEGDTRSVAHDTIASFLNSAKSVSEGGNGGFYIGRYEQGEGNVCKAGVNAYVNVSSTVAKTKAKAMYTNKNQYGATSELINSYAWDTALNFICQNSEHGYTLATTTDDTYGNIGTGSSGKTLTGGYPADCYSNIYDFLGNCAEWTTEYSSNRVDDSNTTPSVDRGGSHRNSGGYAAMRSNNSTVNFYDYFSFRISLYV